jgi:hypothetical protein
MRKILFLDMDGVVLSLDDLHTTHNHRYLNPNKVAFLNRIAEESRCQFVMSSVWRSDPSVRGLLKDAGFIGEWARPWKTPHDPGIPGECTRRGIEIAAWFKQARLDPAEVNYVILDDDSDMLPEQMPYFLKVPCQTGLNRAHVMNAVGILNRERLPSDANRNPHVAALNQ